MPRLIDADRCPHCAEELPKTSPEERGAVCPRCGGSLQQRYLRAGCFSSAPPVLLAGVLVLRWLLDS